MTAEPFETFGVKVARLVTTGITKVERLAVMNTSPKVFVLMKVATEPLSAVYVVETGVTTGRVKIEEFPVASTPVVALANGGMSTLVDAFNGLTNVEVELLVACTDVVVMVEVKISVVVKVFVVPLAIKISVDVEVTKEVEEFHAGMTDTGIGI